ncbi:AAA family ATPase [Lentisphaerota bacterium WC36G]|nr:AAA family ATPase [Lentisphaerae bacterium WC36]
MNELYELFESNKYEVHKDDKTILGNIVELRLLATLGTKEIFKWLPDGRYIENKNFFRISNYTIVVKAHKHLDLKTRDLNKKIADLNKISRIFSTLLKDFYKTGNSKIRAFEIKSMISNIIEESQKSENKNHFKGDNLEKLGSGIVKELCHNDTEHINTMRKLVRRSMHKIEGSINNLESMITENFIQDREQFFVGQVFCYEGYSPSLVQVYSDIENLPIEQAVDRLIEIFNLKRNIFKDINLGRSKKWQRINIDGYQFNGQNNDILFTKANGLTSGIVSIYKENDKTVLRPATFWQEQNTNQFRQLNVPFSKPYPLLSLNNIANYYDKVTPIMLTENLLVADQLAKNNYYRNIEDFNQYICSSWWGGSEHIDDVNWSSLKDKNVTYFVTPSGKENELKKHYKTALKIYNKLHNKVKILSFKILEKVDVATFSVSGIPQNIENHAWKIKTLSDSDFLKKASNEYSLTPDEIKSTSHSRRTISQPKYHIINHKVNIHDLNAMQYIIKPVIPEGSINLLYSQTGIGKTWVALSIAYAVSASKPPFEYWKLGDIKDVSVLYVDSELGRDAMLRRLQLMEKIYNVKLQDNKNFHCISLLGSDMNLTDEDNQSIIEKNILAINKGKPKNKHVKLIFLDNLTTLTEFNDSQKSWRELFAWLKEFRDEGMSFFLVHHSNKAGKERGSSVKSATVDNVIAITKLDDYGPHEIALKVNIEKGRTIFGSDKDPFSVVLTPPDAKKGWRSVAKQLSEQEKDDIVTERHKQGVKIDLVAKELGITRDAINKRRKKLGLTRSYSKK